MNCKAIFQVDFKRKECWAVKDIETICRTFLADGFSSPYQNSNTNYGTRVYNWWQVSGSTTNFLFYVAINHKAHLYNYVELVFCPESGQEYEEGKYTFVQFDSEGNFSQWDGPHLQETAFIKALYWMGVDLDVIRKNLEVEITAHEEMELSLELRDSWFKYWSKAKKSYQNLK